MCQMSFDGGYTQLSLLSDLCNCFPSLKRPKLIFFVSSFFFFSLFFSWETISGFNIFIFTI